MELCKIKLNLTESDIKFLYFNQLLPQERTFYNISQFLPVRFYFVIKRMSRFENLRVPYWSFKARRYGIRPYFPLVAAANTLIKRFNTNVFLKKKMRRLRLKCLSYTVQAKVRHIANFRHTQPFSLKERIFLSHKTIQRTIWEFLYKGVRRRKLNRRGIAVTRRTRKNNRPVSQKHIFLNAHKPLIWKMRNARYAHWALRTRGKLNEYRYDKLLGTELNFIGKTKTYLLLPFIIFTTLTSFLSWKQIKQVMEYGLFIYNGRPNWLPEHFAVGDIVELPLGLTLKKTQRRMKFRYRMILNKARRATYKNFIARKRFGVRKPISIPKVFKKLPIANKQLRDRFAFDPSLRAFAVIHPLTKLTRDIEHRLTKSSVLTLQNWRYRFD